MYSLSVQAIRKPPEDLAREFDSHKWKTIFHDDSVVHTVDDSSQPVTWNKKKRIGAGGYGTVWLQEMESGFVWPGKPGWEWKELRAVKMLDRDPHISTCQIQELQALVMLKEYPRLFVNFLGWYENIEHTFLVMEYIKDGDLSKYIADHEGGPKPIVEAKEITRQILHGLRVLHSLKIYHRDLKPQNILVACLDPIWVKIADFGVAKREASTSLRTQVGTYGYMAPELLGYFPRRKPRKPAYALDMWSLGILVHEIVTFKTPFCIRETDPEPELNPDSDPESDSTIYETGHGSASGTFPLDEDLLKKYCLGHKEFPADLLERSQLDTEGIDFLKALLAATPKERLTAASALMSPWLEEPDLKKEFLLLGLDPDQIAYQLYPEAKLAPLLKEATRNGYNLAIEKLLRVTPISGYLIKGLLLLAITRLQYETANTLLRRGCRHLRSLADEEEVLHWALETRCTEVIDILLEGGIFDITPPYWGKLYHPVIRTGNVKILQRVIKRADINHITGSGSPLEVAARFGCIDTVNLLLDSGADGTPEALYNAIEGGHLGVVRVLLGRVVEMGKKLQLGIPAILESAASLGHLEVVKLLLERGADVKGSPNAVPFAASGGHLEVVKLLLDNGASAGDNPKVLMSALTSGHPGAEEFLLDSGADPRGAPAPAAKGGHSDVAKPLLDDGSDLFIP